MANNRTRRTRPPVEIMLPSSAIFNEDKNYLIVSDRQLTDLYNQVKVLQVQKELRKPKSRATRLADCFEKIADAKLEIEELKNELEDWQSNMDGTNLEATEKYGQLDEAISLLDDYVTQLEEFDGKEDEVEFPGMF